MTTRPTNAELFCAAGRALFGENWQQPTARLLGWTLTNGQNRAVQRIAAAGAAGEDYRISPGALEDLRAALGKRRNEILNAEAGIVGRLNGRD